jgi:uncharacterized protein (TIGR00369 family)
MVTIEQLQTMNHEVPFVKLLGIEITAVEQGICRARMPYDDQLSQYYGLVHGGVIASLADTMVYLAQTTLNGITKNTVTTNLGVNYLSPAKQEDLYAEGRVIKNGKKIIYGEVSITNASGRLIAHATATYLRLEYDMRA